MTHHKKLCFNYFRIHSLFDICKSVICNLTYTFCNNFWGCLSGLLIGIWYVLYNLHSHKKFFRAGNFVFVSGILKGKN